MENKLLQLSKKNKYLEMIPKFQGNKTQKITFFIFTLCAFSFFGLFAINPTISTILELQQKIDDNQSVIDQMDEKIRNLQTLKVEYSKLQNNKDLDIILSALPNNPALFPFAAKLQTLAIMNGVLVKELSIKGLDLTDTANSKKAPKPTATEMAFSVSTEGTYKNLLEFMRAISNFDRVVTLDTLSISKQEKDEKQPDQKLPLTLSISGQVYYKQ